MYKIILVAGARPNFMKIAPLMHAFKNHPSIEAILVHTGQHYDAKMSQSFFDDLDIPAPKINLEIGSASHAVQTARIMEAFEKVCLDEQPNAILVVGDVNSTVACSLVAAKMGITSIHYEAGLRSNDRTMPEEINRLATDAISDYFITTSDDATENLFNEGHDKNKIFMLGNLMIDSLVYSLDKFNNFQTEYELLNKKRTININDEFGKYAILTFHRPNNVDNPAQLSKLFDEIEKISKKIKLVFPIHPRTYKNIKTFGLEKRIKAIDNLYLIEPLGYADFTGLIKNATFILTDSGGIQEETTYLKVPCLTVRPTTERPITIWEGSNTLIKIDDIGEEVNKILNGNYKAGKVPKCWDGKTALRIVEQLEKIKKERI